MTEDKVVSLDRRMGAVEQALAGLTVQVMETREDVREYLSAHAHTPRKDTCPHNEDFVRIMAALEAGGKRFGSIEGELARAVAERKATTENHEQRLSYLEQEWLKALQSYRTARWLVGLLAALLGWMARDILPLLDRLGG